MRRARISHKGVGSLAQIWQDEATTCVSSLMRPSSRRSSRVAASCNSRASTSRAPSTMPSRNSRSSWALSPIRMAVAAGSSLSGSAPGWDRWIGPSMVRSPEAPSTTMREATSRAP